MRPCDRVESARDLRGSRRFVGRVVVDWIVVIMRKTVGFQMRGTCYLPPASISPGTTTSRNFATYSQRFVCQDSYGSGRTSTMHDLPRDIHHPNFERGLGEQGGRTFSTTSVQYRSQILSPILAPMPLSNDMGMSLVCCGIHVAVQEMTPTW
jgi:hypothetical protein